MENEKKARIGTIDGYCEVEEVGENIRLTIGTEPKSARVSITIDGAGARSLGSALVGATGGDAVRDQLAKAVGYVLERALLDPARLGYHLGPCVQSWEQLVEALAAHRGEDPHAVRAEFAGGAKKQAAALSHAGAERVHGHAGDADAEPDDEQGLADMHDEGDSTPDTIDGRMI